MKLAYGPWHPKLDWTTPAGRALKTLAESLPEKHSFRITVFGSAPLQLAIDRGFLSADIDIFSEDDFSDLIRELHLGRGQRRLYVEQNPGTVFRSATDWHTRAFTTMIKKVEFCFPHPIDLLVSKLQRLAPKDLRAFKLVQAKTGFPKERDLVRALRNAVDLYRSPLPGERLPGDIFANTRKVWRELFGKDIDVQKRIIGPALAGRAEAYGLDLPNWKGQLTRLTLPGKRKPHGRRM